MANDGARRGAQPDEDVAPIARVWTLLAEVVNELPIAVWMIDARGVFTLSEGGALKGIGLSPGELVGASAFERWASQPEMLDGMKAALHGDRAFDQRDTGGRTFAGRIAPIRAPGGEIAGAVGIALDVTERVVAERALKSAELRFRDLIEGAPDGMLVHDGTTVHYANPALATALGYAQPSDLVGNPTGNIFLAKDREMLRERMRRALETGVANPPIELELKTNAAATRWFECSSRAIEHRGQPEFLIQARDIEERRAMAARLVQAEQLASLGTLAAGVAHEINNPLTYVLMNLELLRRRAKAGDAAWADAAREIEAATEGVGRVRDIVADLRSFSRRGDGASTLLDVRTVLDAALRMAWSEIHHRAEVERAYAEVPAVEATESRLAQVFLNLLLNAAQSFHEPSSRRHSIRVATRAASGQVLVEISDDGPGMSEETAARAFEPFYTTKPAGVGTGLGLSICRSIVTSLGGAITVESTLGRGTTFRVSLPAHLGPAKGRPSSTPAPPTTKPIGRALVVDDERAIGDGLRRALDGAWEVDVASSAAEALAHLARTAYDAVLCDLMMPDVSGIELFEQVRAERPELAPRFVFMTGGAYTTQARAFLATISAPCLEKPFSIDELHDALSRASALCSTPS